MPKRGFGDVPPNPITMSYLVTVMSHKCHTITRGNQWGEAGRRGHNRVQPSLTRDGASNRSAARATTRGHVTRSVGAHRHNVDIGGRMRDNGVVMTRSKGATLAVAALLALGGCRFDSHGLPSEDATLSDAPARDRAPDRSPDQLSPDLVACSTGQTRPCYSGPDGTEGVGLCRAGTQSCQGSTWGQCRGEVLPVAETCDGEDNNCNGVPDDGLTGKVTQSPVLARAGPPDAKQVCEPNNLLKEDGAMVGLAFVKTSGMLDKQKITACVRAEFRTLARVEQLRVVARGVAATCGGSCKNTGCGKGRDFWVFTSEDNKTYKLLKIIRNIGATVKAHLLPVGRKLRHVLICRGQHVAFWDHLEVDHVSATYANCPSSP